MGPLTRGAARRMKLRAGGSLRYRTFFLGGLAPGLGGASDETGGFPRRAISWYDLRVVMPRYRLKVGGIAGGRDQGRLEDGLRTLEIVRAVHVTEADPDGTEEVVVRVEVSDPVNDLREIVESLGYTLLDLETG